MGVRCFSPHNMIGLEGLVVDQAWKLRSLPTSHQLSPRIQCGLQLSARALRSCGRIILFSREQGPGDPCRLIGERDNRSIEPSPRREPLQPLRTAIVMLRQSKHHRAGAVDHLPPEIMIGAPANAAEPGFAAGRILTRDKADPCRELPPGSEMAAVVNRGDERRRDHRPNAWKLRKPAASFVRPANSGKLLIKLLKPQVEAVELVKHVAEERPRQIGQVGPRDRVARLRQEAPCALRQNRLHTRQAVPAHG